VSWINQLGSALETWNKRSFVVSPDVDGLICGSMLLEKYPAAPCIGSYDSEHLLHFDGATKEEIKAALWIDLDVTHPDIICVGQHLIFHDKMIYCNDGTHTRLIRTATSHKTMRDHSKDRPQVETNIHLPQYISYD